MKSYFVDTNVFLRYLVNDEPDHADRVEKLLNKAERGEISLITGPPVFFELAWTLKSFYGMQKNKICDCLLGIAGIKGLDITDIDIVVEALELYSANPIEFADAYIAALSRHIGAHGIATFNKKHFDRLDVNVYPL